MSFPHARCNALDPAEVAEAICRRSRVGADLWQSVRMLPSSKVGPLELCTRQGGIGGVQTVQVLTCEEPWCWWDVMDRFAWLSNFSFQTFWYGHQSHMQTCWDMFILIVLGSSQTPYCYAPLEGLTRRRRTAPCSFRGHPNQGRLPLRRLWVEWNVKVIQIYTDKSKAVSNSNSLAMPTSHSAGKRQMTSQVPWVVSWRTHWWTLLWIKRPLARDDMFTICYLSIHRSARRVLDTQQVMGKWGRA